MYYLSLLECKPHEDGALPLWFTDPSPVPNIVLDI